MNFSLSIASIRKVLLKGQIVVSPLLLLIGQAKIKKLYSVKVRIGSCCSAPEKCQVVGGLFNNIRGDLRKEKI